jgi:hypothetical protein
MNILNEKDVQVLISLMIEDLPFCVFNIVRQNIKISEARIIGEIIDIFPSTVKVQKIRRLCTSIIHWFVHNGDISNNGNRNYSVLPPYGVYSSENEIILKLHGDLPIQELRQKFEEIEEIKFETELKKWPWEKNGSTNIGFQSSLYFDKNLLDTVGTRMTDLSIPLVSIANICSKLPKIDDLLFPPRSSFDVDFPRWGIWSKYNPSILGNNRWVNIDNILAHPPGLLMWQQNNDWRGKNSRRYFLNNSYEKYAELSESTAILWTYYFDCVESNLRHIFIGDDFIYTPFEIPNPYIQWLQAVASDWHGEGEYKKFYITEANDVKNVLEKNLRLTTKFEID